MTLEGIGLIVMSDSRELFGIQMLRGIAAVMVVIHHTLEESLAAAVGPRSPDWMTTAGAAGVDLFFVISGFIMLYVSFPTRLEASKPGLFLFRRATRIYPLYWICCAAVVALWAIGLFASRAILTSVVIKSALLVPTPNTLIGVSWTLSYEIYFYLIFAATLTLRSRVASAIVTTLTIATFLVMARGLPESSMTDFLVNAIVLEFCFGLLLALAWFNGFRPTSLFWSLPGFILIIVAPLFVAHSNTNGLPPFARTIVWGLPAVFVLTGFLSVGPPKNRWTRFAVLVGDASYAIYLTHSFVMVIYAKLLISTPLGALPQTAIIPIVIAACIAAGLMTHFLVERPILAMIRNLTRGKKLQAPQGLASKT